MKIDHIKSAVIGSCECCGEAVYAPPDVIAREALQAIPDGRLSEAEAVVIYETIVQSVGNIFAPMDDEGDEDAIHAVN